MKKYDWRITPSNDGLTIEIPKDSDSIETKIKDVKYKNNVITFTEGIKKSRGKEIIQYYLKSISEDKIEGQ